MDVDGTLRRQAGVISRRQALVAGLSSTAISARVASGRWRSVFPGIYLASHHAMTDEARLRGAVLWAGADAVVSGVAAAWWFGVWPGCPSIVEVYGAEAAGVAGQAGGAGAAPGPGLG